MDTKAFVEKYLTDRRGTDSSKWDQLKEKFGRTDLLPLWIADMEFRTCDAVTNALMARVRHGIYGYSAVPDSYYAALDRWMTIRHNCSVPKEWVRFSTGCVTGIAWAIAAFTDPGDACMILTPVYYPFHNVVTNNKRTLVKVPLQYRDGYASMDYEAIEKAIVENHVKLFIQCSPQNPMGRVFTEEELDKVLSICQRHQVLVIRKDDAGKIKSMDDLAKNHGKLVPIAPQDARYNVIASYNTAHPDQKIDLVSSENFHNSDAYTWVMEGRYDAYLEVELSYQNNIAKENAPYHKFVDQLVYLRYKGIPTYALVNKKEVKLCEEVDKAIEELRKDGTIDKLEQKYFGESLQKYLDQK